MVQTRLVRPAKRLVEAWCPACHHVRRIYDNTQRGAAHCMYCGADFEWEDNGQADGSTVLLAAWPAVLVDTLSR